MILRASIFRMIYYASLNWPRFLAIYPLLDLELNDGELLCYFYMVV